MHREHDRELLVDLLEHGEQAPQMVGVVHVARAMEREGHVAAGRQSQALEGVALARAGEVRAQRVDHDVADDVDAPRENALAQEVLATGGLGHEQPVGDRVGQHAVDLFGHAAVARAQARFDVRHAHAELRGRERGGERRVHVADHDQGVRALLEQQGLHLAEHLGRLAAWLPEPTSRFTSGVAMPSSRKKLSDIASS